MRTNVVYSFSLNLSTKKTNDKIDQQRIRLSYIEGKKKHLFQKAEFDVSYIKLVRYNQCFFKTFLFVLFEEEEVLIISVFTINFPVVVPQL